MSAEENLQRMKTLDDAWNAQNWEVFRKRHSVDTKVYWPGQPDPTRGRDAHQAESEAFFKSIENHLENNPYRVMFGSGDWTCTIARWKGKMIGPWMGLDGKMHDATGKTFELEFCTVARWKDGEIIEENLTGFIVEDEISGVAAVGRLPQLDRGAVRRRFETRFTARRMALDYLAAYSGLMEASAPRTRIKLVSSAE